MRGAFSDPQGPWAWRSAPYAVPIAILLLAIFGPLPSGPAGALALVSMALFHLIGLLPLRQRKPRTAEIRCAPGHIDIRGAGSRNQRIALKSVTGATTARTKDGVLLTLQHRKRTQPLTIAVATDAEAEQIRHALGIGHGGFGTVGWRTLADNGAGRAFVGRVLATVLPLAALVLMLTSSESVLSGMSIFMAVCVAALGALFGLGELLGLPPAPTVVMTAEGLRLRTPRGWFALPYEGVLRIDDHRDGFVFGVPPPYGQVAVETSSPTFGGLGPRDREILAAQVSAAAARARGLGPRKNDVTGRIDILRRKGESARDWLVRLDMTGQMLTTAPGYRGNTLDTEDLWAILEDPDAEAELRAAAARVLRHAPHPEARARIAAAVAAVRDDSTNQRLRIAVRDDLDDASQELAYLDASEPTARRAQAMPVR